MNKLLAMIVIAMMLFSTALAEIVWVDPYANLSQEAAMSEYLAAKLTEKLGETVTVDHEETTERAVNAFLALPESNKAVLMCNQDAMILSLQGYTNQDLRKALLPVTQVALSDSCFFISPTVVEAVPEGTEDALFAYSKENPYELFIARLTDASHADYLTLEATNNMYVDQNLYVDYEEAAMAAQEGAPDFLVLSTAMLPQAAESYIRMSSTGLPGLWQGIFVHGTAARDLLDSLGNALHEICMSEDWQNLIAEAGYVSAPCPDQTVFQEEVTQLFSDYVRYLTSEGLFFYEQ